MADTNPLCDRKCGRIASYDHESEAWSNQCAKCTGMHTYRMPGAGVCSHFGYSAGLLAPTHDSHTGEHVGWLCTGVGIDRCGTSYGLDGKQTHECRSWSIYVDQPHYDKPRLFSLGYTAESDAVDRIEQLRSRYPKGTGFTVEEVFADGPLVGQIAREVRV